jgi:hypothetical protein
VRLIFPVLSLLLGISTIAVDLVKLPPSSPICLHGLCRFDQLYAAIGSDGANSKNLGELLNEDPSNPSAWCSYAEMLWKRGDIDGARSAFSVAISLGPTMSPVLMRGANFAFSQGQQEDALALSKRILQQTGAFDEILFSYLQRSKMEVPKMLAAGLPDDPRAVKAWLAWVGRHGTDQDIADTWTWIKTRRVCDQSLAIESVRLLWDRKSYEAAQAVWANWVGPAEGYLKSDRLFNRRFQNPPAASPFDWKLEAMPSVEISRRDGVDVRFMGQDNVSFSHIHQFATVSPGQYRFSAEIETHGLASDERPYFHVFDAEPLRKVDVRTPPVGADTGRSWILLDFDVPPGTRAMEVEIARRASESRDNKIIGTLHVYQVSLARL